MSVLVLIKNFLARKLEEIVFFDKVFYDSYNP